MRHLRMLVLVSLCLVPLSFVHAADPDRGSQSPSFGFDIASLDRSVDACTDFYQFACGGWITRNPIPADQSRWGRFNELADRNRITLREILEKAAPDQPGRDVVDQKMGDYYASCIDEATIEAKGLTPLKPELDRIATLKKKSDFAKVVAHLHNLGVGVLFHFGSVQDFKDATQVIAIADQGGLGLPDRDYYFKDDPKSIELRRQYVSHIQRMFELTGAKPNVATAHATVVMELETALAKVSLDLVARRDPEKIYHKMTRQELLALAPAFAWDQYLQGIQAPPFKSLHVTVPDFFKGMGELVKGHTLQAWKIYFHWHLLHASASILPTAFVEADFDFYGKTLTGARELRPRWKRCVDFVDSDLGEALGQRYVEKTFGSQGKERMLTMVAALERALEKNIHSLPWMTDPTKKEALKKLGTIANKIGYPDIWRDYSALKIVRGDAFGNSQRANAFELNRQLDKIGKPVDRKEWHMSPPTVNAYYDPLMNNINFPAGILQPPFFDNAMDDAVNFGAIGAVIGHELTHGFDDQGRKFGANGNLQDWWSEIDAKEFENRAACFVDQFGSYTAVADVKLNGKLTLGENVADNGGLRIAYLALQDVQKSQKPILIDGFTADQRLFLGLGQIWCQNVREEASRMLAQVDPHSPGHYRVNGVVANMPEFQKAFSCKAGAPMVREKACRVW